MAEACRQPRHELVTIFPGSWIDANLYIWIGHRDDHRAWSQLADARDALDEASGVEPGDLARAREEVLIAEGSDWFWWYGDDHSSAHDPEFDDLFRRHLRNVYRLLGRPIPEELFVSNISTGGPAAAETAPSAFFTPTLDGEETSYFEWLGAGTLEIRDVAGAMHRIDRKPGVLTQVQFGFDREWLYVRLDAGRPLSDLLADGYQFAVTFLQPDGVRFTIRQALGRLAGSFLDRRATDQAWVERGPGGARIAAGTVVEAALPLSDLRVAAGSPLWFTVAVYDPGQNEVERQPGSRPVELVVPDEQFEARNWSA
jgi:hypothetical protein